MKLFFDENIGSTVPDALRHVGAPAQDIARPRKGGVVGLGATDIERVRHVGANGCLGLTEDLKNSPEPRGDSGGAALAGWSHFPSHRPVAALAGAAPPALALGVATDGGRVCFSAVRISMGPSWQSAPHLLSPDTPGLKR